jgi:hypothetical protein
VRITYNFRVAELPHNHAERSHPSGPPPTVVPLTYASNERDLERARVNCASMWLLGSLILTPVAWAAAVLSSTWPNPWPATVLFPYTMIAAVNRPHVIGGPFFLLGVVQFPLYGFVLTMASLSGRRAVVLIALTLVHAGVAVTCLLLWAS